MSAPRSAGDSRTWSDNQKETGSSSCSSIPFVLSVVNRGIYFVLAALVHSLHEDDDDDVLPLTDIFCGSVEVSLFLFLSQPTTANIIPNAATAIHLLIESSFAYGMHSPIHGRRRAAAHWPASLAATSPKWQSPGRVKNSRMAR